MLNEFIVYHRWRIERTGALNSILAESDSCDKLDSHRSLLRVREVNLKITSRIVPIVLFVILLFQNGAPVEPANLLNILREEVQIPMRDGVKLSATLYRPDQPGKYPALVYRTPYGKEEYEPYPAFPIKAAKRGYLVFLVDVRGRYRSEGEFRAYQNEKPDGYDLIEWVGKNPLCTGAVGTFGYSYPGIVQWLALSQDPPHLKAAVPGMTPIDSHHFFYVGGAFSLTWMDWFLPNIFPDKRKRSGDTSVWDEEDWQKTKQKWYAFRPLSEFPLLKKYGPEYYDWLAHPDKSSWWDFTSVETEFPKMKAPVLLISGWYDATYGPIGATEGFRRMKSEGGSAVARKNSRLVLGPWNHTSLNVRKTKFGEIDFGPSAGFDYEEELLQFYDCELKGICANEDLPPVSIFVMGENKWRSASDWPLSEAVSTSYYLHGKGVLNSNQPSKESVDRYVFDPASPLWDTHYELSVPYDQREIEKRKDVLVYTTEPVQADTEVTGEIVAELFVSSSAKDTDFAITLCDVYPDGTSINLSGLDAGYLRMRYRNGFEKQELMNPGTVYKIRIGQLYTSNLFKRGHRIRLQVTSSKAPHYDPNPNTGTEIATESKLIPADQSIHQSSKYPSRLILPIIPRK